MYAGARDAYSSYRDNLQEQYDEVFADQEEFVKNWDKANGDVRDSDIYKQNAQQLQDLGESIDNCNQKIKDYSRSINDLPLEKLRNVGTELSRATAEAER